MTLSVKSDSVEDAIQRNGVDAITIDNTNITVKGNLVVDGSNPMIGEGQTWQDMTGSRAHSTTYTNSTGKPIMVAIACSNSTTREILVDSVAVGYLASADAAGAASFIVPDGSDYIIDGSVTSILIWSELR